MTSFNLIHEPWIPCVLPDGIAELSLNEAFRRADEIEEIADPSPLITATLYRLLLAITHRVFGPESDVAWQGLWTGETWDIQDVLEYLNRCVPRFDLFDATWPFYQAGAVDFRYAGPVIRLIHELGPPNARLFSHTGEDSPVALTPARAARYLLAYQGFSPGGLVGFEEGQSEHRSARAAPLVRGAVAVIKGSNLRETLVLNLVVCNPEDDEPFALNGEDMPAWERRDQLTPTERRPNGYLDWLTWQSRRIRLQPEQVNGQTVVRRAVLMKGEQLPRTAAEHEYEMMMAFRRLKEVRAGESDETPIGFQVDRALWRDSLVLLIGGGGAQAIGRSGRPAETVRALGNRAWKGSLDRHQFPMDLHGIVTDQFNVLLWRQERLPLDTAYLTEKVLQDALSAAVMLAESVASALMRATRTLAERLIAPDVDQQPDARAVAELVGKFGAGRLYWSGLGPRFDAFVLRQPAEQEAGTVSEAYQTWAAAVLGRARESFDVVRQSLDLERDERTIRAIVAADRQLGGLLWHITHTQAPILVRKEQTHEPANS